jgi:hypothetical protein
MMRGAPEAGGVPASGKRGAESAGAFGAPGDVAVVPGLVAVGGIAFARGDTVFGCAPGTGRGPPVGSLGPLPPGIPGPEPGTPCGDPGRPGPELVAVPDGPLPPVMPGVLTLPVPPPPLCAAAMLVTPARNAAATKPDRCCIVFSVGCRGENGLHDGFVPAARSSRPIDHWIIDPRHDSALLNSENLLSPALCTCECLYYLVGARGVRLLAREVHGAAAVADRQQEWITQGRFWGWGRHAAPPVENHQLASCDLNTTSDCILVPPPRRPTAQLRDTESVSE